METQLTAVEWLETQFQKDNLSKEILNVFKRSFEQAKAMEKEQIENAFNQGYTQFSIEDLEPKSRERFVDAKDYYNKTFKSE